MQAILNVSEERQSDGEAAGDGLFPGVRRAPTALVVAAVVIPPLVVWGFTHWPAAMAATNAATRATGGLATSTLLLGGAILVLVALVLRVFGGLGARELGLRMSDLRPAIWFGLLLWLVLSAFAVIGSLAVGQEVVLARAWSAAPSATAGKLIAQLFGNALCEEAIWRGFLVPQLFFRLPGAPRSAGRMFVAMMIAGSLFAAYHVPMDLAHGRSATALAILLLARALSGLLFAAVWLWSENLLVAVVTHALLNEPSLLFAAEQSAWIQAVAGLGPLAWFGWLRLRRARS